MLLLRRLAFFWSTLRTDGRVMWQVIRHTATPGWLKFTVFLPIIYLFSPLDIIPDAIPLLGVVDDVLVVGLIPKFWRFLLSKAPPEVQSFAQEQAVRHKDVV